MIDFYKHVEEYVFFLIFELLSVTSFSTPYIKHLRAFYRVYRSIYTVCRQNTLKTLLKMKN